MISELPMQIKFHALDESWMIYYEPCKTKLELIERPSREIVLIGSMQEKNKGKEKLLAWIKNKSKIHLLTHLIAMSQKTELTYKKVTIRDQKSIWGSCTAKKSISLNYKLIFLPKALVDYVMIHELCHTKHLDHSKNFWHLVSHFDPVWKKNRLDLRHANLYIPKFA